MRNRPSRFRTLLAEVGKSTRGAGRLALGFGISTVVLAVLSFVTIPVMIGASGAVIWGQIALGQTVGGLLAVIVGWGWNVDGPARVAGAGTEARAAEFRFSLRVKTVLLLPALGVAWAIGLLMNPGDPLPAALGATISAVSGLTPLWYFVGVRKPFINLAVETLPRTLLTVVAIVAMIAGASAVAGATIQIAAIVVSAVVASIWVMRQDGRPIGATDPLFAGLWVRRHGLSAALLSMAYAGAPMLIVYIVAPGSQPQYAIYDRVIQQVSTGISPIVTTIQGWAPLYAASRRHMKSALWFIVLSAAAGFVLLWILAPPFISILGRGEIAVTPLAGVLIAACTALFYLDAATVKALLPLLGRLHVATPSLIAGIVVGLPLVAIGAMLAGATGALVGVAAGLLLRVVVIVSVSTHVLSSSPTWPPPLIRTKKLTAQDESAPR